VSFTEKVRQAGKTPATRVLRFERIRASEAEPEIAVKLQIDTDRELFAITRLRLADSIPVILERRWVPTDIFPGLNRQELRGSFYDLCREKYKLRIAESDQTIRSQAPGQRCSVSRNSKRITGLSGFSGGIFGTDSNLVGEDPLSWRRVRISSCKIVPGKAHSACTTVNG
jgi:hypothetical protein